MFRLALVLSIFFNSSISLASFRPLDNVCRGSSGNIHYTITSDHVPYQETSCTKTVYDSGSHTLTGIMCMSSYGMFLSFPNEDDWYCQHNSRPGYWSCRGVGRRNRNYRLNFNCYQG